MQSARQQLIYERGADSMEQECVCAEAGLHGVSAARRHRRSGWQWQQRATHQLLLLLLLLLVVALLLSVVLALLVIFGFERDWRAPHHHDHQARLPPVSLPADTGESEEQVKTFNPPSQNDGRTPRAMLTAALTNQTSGDPLQWETEVGNSFYLGGFNYSDGNLVVPRDGFYRVFLQVTFEIPDEWENQPLSCAVLALSESYRNYNEILKTEDFAECCNCMKTLYTSALFHFKEKTMLKVKTNEPYIIIKDEKLVFFGAELLPD